MFLENIGSRFLLPGKGKINLSFSSKLTSVRYIHTYSIYLMLRNCDCTVRTISFNAHNIDIFPHTMCGRMNNYPLHFFSQDSQDNLTCNVNLTQIVNLAKIEFTGQIFPILDPQQSCYNKDGLKSPADNRFGKFVDANYSQRFCQNTSVLFNIKNQNRK